MHASWLRVVVVVAFAVYMLYTFLICICICMCMCMCMCICKCICIYLEDHHAGDKEVGGDWHTFGFALGPHRIRNQFTHLHI